MGLRGVEVARLVQLGSELESDFWFEDHVTCLVVGR